MNFIITTIARSLAGHLAPVLPDVTFYEDPNQQDSRMPAAFLQQRYSHLERRTGQRWLRRIGLDLTCLEDYNLPDLQQRYLAMAEALDLSMEIFPYTDGSGEGSVLLRTYDRKWNIDLDALHYKFELREMVELPDPKAPSMQRIAEYDAEVIPNDGRQKTPATVHP